MLHQFLEAPRWVRCVSSDNETNHDREYSDQPPEKWRAKKIHGEARESRIATAPGLALVISTCAAGGESQAWPAPILLPLFSPFRQASDDPDDHSLNRARASTLG